MFTLDQKALDHIENRRNYNPKKDIEFYIFIRMEILKTFINIADNNFLGLGTKNPLDYFKLKYIKKKFSCKDFF